MNNLSKITKRVLAGVCMLMAINVHASLIEFSFYDSPSFNGNVVGTAVLSFDEILVDGSYTLDSLTNVAFNANFNSGDSFSFSDFEDSASNVLAILTSTGNQQLFNFGNVNFDSPGQSNGSADFVNNSGVILTFEPGINGGIAYGVYDSINTNDVYFGFYEAIVSNNQIPEPSTLAILLLGVAGLASRRK